MALIVRRGWDVRVGTRCGGVISARLPHAQHLSGQQCSGVTITSTTASLNDSSAGLQSLCLRGQSGQPEAGCRATLGGEWVRRRKCADKSGVATRCPNHLDPRKSATAFSTNNVAPPSPSPLLAVQFRSINRAI
jgi:hypothetical protein